jgi:hypothetical protein
LKKTLADINVLRKGVSFCAHPERIPVKVIFQESRLPFREALAKRDYLIEMNRRMRDKLIKTGKWFPGGAYRRWIETAPYEEVFGPD